jgi:hypothetical protein
MPPSNHQDSAVRVSLAKALSQRNAYEADLVTRESTSISVYPASFLKSHKIYRVEHRNPYKPVVFFAAFSPGRQAYILTFDPQAFITMARTDGVSIESPEAAVEYAVAFLETTRSMSELIYLVRRVDDVRFRPGLSGDSEIAMRSFQEKYRSVIVPPAATPSEEGYLVTAYTVHQQSLVRHSILVKPRGELRDDPVVLEQNLPLVYGL